MIRHLAASPVMPGPLHGEESIASDTTHATMLELISWLLRYPLLRASDLATLMGLSASATVARLARARADGLVRSMPASLLGRHVARLHALTPRGLAALAAQDGAVVWERARHCQADPVGLLQLLADLPAMLATQAFVLALIAHAEEALCRQPAQRVTWSWTRHVHLRSLSTDSVQHSGHPSLCCDARVQLVVRSTAPRTVISYGLIMLWDSGLSRAADVRRDLQTFLRIRDSYERHGMLTAFPTLLVLTPNVRRAALWQAQALRLATERWLTHPLSGGALEPDDNALVLSSLPISMDPMNPWQAAWRSFAQPGTQSLSDILQSASDVGAGSSTLWQMACRRGCIHDQMELARLTVRLDVRSLRMLIVLYLHPLLSTQQLATVLGIQPTSAERMLRRLRRLDLIQRQMLSGVQLGALADRGVLLLAHCAHLPGGARAVQTSGHLPRTLWRYQREVRALARTPEHTAGVYSFFVALLQSCRAERAQGLDAALLWWEIGARCARAFHDAGAWQVIRPDGAGEWRVDGQRFRFWLEWDRGTMGPRDLSAKFTAYARYLQSGEWRVDGNEPLPALLIVTQSDEQMARLEQALKEALPTSFLPQVVLALTAELRAHGPLSAIWRRWRVDSAHRHVLLERQWTPVTSVSLP